MTFDSGLKYLQSRYAERHAILKETLSKMEEILSPKQQSRKEHQQVAIQEKHNQDTAGISLKLVAFFLLTQIVISIIY